MMIVTTDNTPLILDSNVPNVNQVIADLSLLASKSIGELVTAHPNLLIFPTHFEYNEDDIASKPIFELKVSESQIVLETGNIMGFIGVKDTQLTIQSRFARAFVVDSDDEADREEAIEEDYFLHYMLQKVLCINLFDLKHSRNQTNLFDFLVYLFPYFLKKALSQGLYKEYQKKTYNDGNLKGAINIKTHVQRNLPFRGNVAYSVREHSFDNPISQLIRHTIELIKQQPNLRDVLHSDSETLDFVNLIVQHTPSYHARDRHNIINTNRKPFVHPYFTEYSGLQKICLQILRYEGLKYANNDDKAHGILFDGAWLWEEYLNTLLRPIGYDHPTNNTRQGGIKVYAQKFSGNNVHRYPDFVKDNSIVLDAKYKRMKDNEINRDDLNQVLSYLFLYKASIGGYIAPSDKTNLELKMGLLNGFGGSIYKFKLAIPQKVVSYQAFKKAIAENEAQLVKSIDELSDMQSSNETFVII
ncbi:5-methylcytosine restriction system specificity protein McrC [Psychrobacter aquimaris]|uniref:5-methylcytosine restriction system specificity protein McrC n=1 Tax=Psychrobacter aquimaris TaxID=292733 RepID=UPI003FCF6003